MQALDITIRRGATIAIPIRIESSTLNYTDISSMTRTSPLRVTATAHGIPDGWRVAIQNAGGMTQLNTPQDSVRDADLRRVTKVDANTLSFDGVNSSAWRAYTSGGQLAWYAPFDLSSYDSARMDVRDAVDGALLAAYNTADGTLEIDVENAVVWLNLSVSKTLLLAAGRHVFDIELIKGSGEVDALCSADSTLTVWPEITTST